ncbi:MAG: type III-A CRISPR-associated protein Cas10/Csm1, partial [Anaerolineae bacterium]|nr:type III-A CRISPR-associated protein Cas10/Csm1 [Anaerolineae bacterium]
SWDAMPDLALEIRDSFARFVAGHPGLHLSAGIALIGAKYPLYQAAADAGDAERQAKEHPGKNAVTFLGQTLDWDTFRQAAEWEGKLRAMCVEVGVPRALLRTLVVLQQQHDDKARERAKEGEDRTLDDRPQAYYGPWNWRAAYVLRRLEERHRSAAREIGELRELLSHEHFTSIRWIGLAARWAELKLRKGE